MTDDTTTADPGCGCCQPEQKTRADVIRDLEARRADVDRRLQALGERRLVGAR